MADQDSLLFAARGCSLQVWHLDTKLLLFTLQNLHLLPITDLAWMDDDKQIVTASHDRSCRVWDVTKQVAALQSQSK